MSSYDCSDMHDPTRTPLPQKQARNLLHPGFSAANYELHPCTPLLVVAIHGPTVLHITQMVRKLPKPGDY